MTNAMTEGGVSTVSWAKGGLVAMPFEHRASVLFLKEKADLACVLVPTQQGLISVTPSPLWKWIVS